MRTATVLLASAVSAMLVACGESNPPELNEAASKAANAYCDCVKSEMKKPVDQIGMGACKAENEAFEKAWEALPVRARDPKAKPITELHHGCYRMLSDARRAGQKK